MRAVELLIAAGIAVQAARILQTNDDGWAELYLRSLNNELTAAGHDVVVSAPAENQSGTGSTDVDPSPRKTPCEYNSCSPSTNPADAAPIGRNASNPRLNWVNSYPATAARYGIDTIAGPLFWGGAAPDLLVSGPNVGSNLWLEVQFSGTVGAASYAAKRGIPALAFSGASSGNLAWNTTPVPARSTVYARLANTMVDKLLKAAGGGAILPAATFLNVNFPEVAGSCTAPENFKWVLSRINPGWISPKDVTTCGSDRLPTETSVIDTEGCYISVSVGDANDKTTASSDKQAVVLARLGSMLSCLPA